MTWNYGFMVELTFGEVVEYGLVPYNQYGEQASMELLESDTFDLKLKELNNVRRRYSILKKRLKSIIEVMISLRICVLNCTLEELWKNSLI